MLSTGHVGTTEGSRIKMGISFPIAPHESSDQAYDRYKKVCRRDRVFRGAFGPDCDSTPCVSREWKLPEFPEIDALDLAVTGWQSAGDMVSRILVALGGDSLDLSLSCMHDAERVRMKVFSQSEFFASVDDAENA